MAERPRTYRINPSRTWTQLKSYRWITGRMGFQVSTLVLRVMDGATGSHRARRHLPNLAMPPTHLLHHLLRVRLTVKEFARSRRQSEFRTLLFAPPLRGRSRQLVLIHRLSCAPRQVLLTLLLEQKGEVPSLKMGKQRQQFARTAKRRTHHYGGGIRRGSLCVSGFAEHDLQVQG